jgi:hypothetical protein
MQESTSLPSPDTSIDNSINQPNNQENLFVTCTICHAVYAPSPNQPQLALASHALLESAFMGMCHFCFRCRRPSCPFCWDMVHGICGSCVLETGLPFRSDVPPLVGTWLPPIRQGQPATNNGATYPLVCIQPGRLERQAIQYEPARPPINTQPPRVAQPVAGAFVGPGGAMPPSQGMPSVQSPMTTMPTGIAANAIMPPMAAMPAVPITPVPATGSQGKKETMSGRSRAAKRKQEEEDHLAPYYIYIDDSADEEVVGDQKNQAVDTDVTPRIRLRRRVEYAFTMFLLIVVALLMIVIIVAAFSAAANSYIAQVVHIDIRAEITYLWQLLTGLFSQH